MQQHGIDSWERCTGDTPVQSHHARSLVDQGVPADNAVNADKAGTQNVVKTTQTTSTRKATERDQTRKDHYLTNDIAGLKQHRTAKPGNIWKATSRRQQRTRNDDDSADIPEPHLSTPDAWEIHFFFDESSHSSDASCSATRRLTCWYPVIHESGERARHFSRRTFSCKWQLLWPWGVTRCGAQSSQRCSGLSPQMCHVLAPTSSGPASTRLWH